MWLAIILMVICIVLLAVAKIVSSDGKTFNPKEFL